MLVSAVLVLDLFMSAAVFALPTTTAADHSRSWESAVQNINGMNSILTLLPVLTGKAQNIRLLASRIYPASFVIAGIGAGRVLLKLQLGLLLCSFDLYRNTVAELSYPHDELVNKFAPKLLHVPTGTPERHKTNMIVNHNVTENYMVEAWFRTQGSPSVVRLKQNNYIRMAVGYGLYLMLYAGETFLSVQNAATGTARLLVGVQSICTLLWLTAVTIIQVRRGPGKREIELNMLHSPRYRCLSLPTTGEHVVSHTFSFHLDNLQGYRLYGADYEQPLLAVAGGLILSSGVLDILSTVLIVGLSTWAYPWIGVEVLVIVVKVIFCVEPLREIEIEDAGPQVVSTVDPGLGVDTSTILPLKINLVETLSCQRVCTDHNRFRDHVNGLEWRSTSAGLWIGQEYQARGNDGRPLKKYLADRERQQLDLADTRPDPQANEALQREFLAALKIVVESNKVPSRDFIAAIDRTLENVKATMNATWYLFGSKEVLEQVLKAKRDFYWRTYL